MKRKGWMFLILILGAVALAACAAPPPPPPTPIRGEALDLAIMAGEWTGEYTSAETGRSGPIRFELTAGEDHVHGQVFLFADPAEPSPHPADPAVPREPGSRTEPLAIRFIAVEEGQVSGTLEPYSDPECERCIISTVFTGKVRGKVIEGTYTSEGGNGGTPRHGTWRVERRG
jgi:hypothetical protein